ncbi:MAG: Hsp20/alpha crystallin family protein [Candidatus Rifleibacteriota bacterium]
MEWKKLAPWNWFQKEEEIPLNRKDNQLDRFSRDPMNEMQTEFNRFFENFAKNFGDNNLVNNAREFSNSFFKENGKLKPCLDISATDKEYQITVELPGIEPEGIKLELRDDHLIVTGEKKHESEVDKDNFYRIERSYGNFRRILSLPEDSDQENINANFKNGIMSIRIPRKQLPGKGSRTIEVKACNHEGPCPPED